jgi:hypothetical protein
MYTKILYLTNYLITIDGRWILNIDIKFSAHDAFLE